MAAANSRLYQQYVEVLTQGTANSRLFQQYTEIVSQGTASARLFQQYVEVLTVSSVASRIFQQYVEVITNASTITSESVPLTITFSQTAFCAQGYGRTVPQTITFSQTVQPGHRHAEVVSQTITFSDSATNVFGGSASNTLVFSQSAVPSLSVDRTASQTFTPTQTAVAHQQFNRDADNTITFTDAARKVSDVHGEDTIVFDDDVVVLHSIRKTVPQTLTITQTVSPAPIYNRTVGQALVMTQVIVVHKTKALTVPQTLTITQVAVGTITKPTYSTITFVQDAEYTVGKHVRHILEITQSAMSATTYNRTANTVFIPFQVIRVNTTLTKPVTQTLTIAQTAVGFVVKSASNTLVMSQSAIGMTVRPAYNHLIYSNVATLTRSRNITGSQIFTITQNVTSKKSKATQASNAFGFNQFARGTRVLSVTVSQTYTPVQDLVRVRTVETVPQTLTLTQVAASDKYVSKTGLNTLVMSQSVNVAKTFRRTVAQTLVFKPSFKKNIGIGNPGGTPGGGTTVDVPDVQPVIVKDVVILQTDDAVITLPPPEFNDKIAGTNRLNIKRSMNGERYVYKRTSITSTLTYDFVLDRIKAKELRAFLLANNSKIIKMENWKGELWAVLLTNNPFSTVEEARWESAPDVDGNYRGNKCRISLDFEGVRTN